MRPVVEFRIHPQTATEQLDEDTSPNSVLPLQQQLDHLTRGLQLLLLPAQQLPSKPVPLRRVQQEPRPQAGGQRRHFEGLLLSEQLNVLADLQKDSVSVQQPG